MWKFIAQYKTEQHNESTEIIDEQSLSTSHPSLHAIPQHILQLPRTHAQDGIEKGRAKYVLHRSLACSRSRNEYNARCQPPFSLSVETPVERRCRKKTPACFKMVSSIVASLAFAVYTCAYRPHTCPSSVVASAFRLVLFIQPRSWCISMFLDSRPHAIFFLVSYAMHG